MPHPAWSTAATAPRRWTTAMAVGRAALQAARFWEIVRILSHRVLRVLRCDELASTDPRRSHPSAVLLPPTRPLAAICQCDQGFHGRHCECPEGMAGANCQIDCSGDASATEYCSHAGVCDPAGASLNLSPVCACTEGKGGRQCELSSVRSKSMC